MSDRNVIERHIDEHEAVLGLLRVPSFCAIAVNDQQVPRSTRIWGSKLRGDFRIADAEIIVRGIEHMITVRCDLNASACGRHEDGIFRSVAVEIADEHRKILQQQKLGSELRRDNHLRLAYGLRGCSGTRKYCQRKTRDCGEKHSPHVPTLFPKMCFASAECGSRKP